MFTFLTLLVACCAARATPLGFPLHHFDTPPSAAFSEPFGRSEARGSSSVVFSASVPELSALTGLSDTVRRTSGDARSILFPGGASDDGNSGDPGEITSTGDAAPTRVFYPGLNRDNTPIEPTSDCVVSDNLTMSYNGTIWKLLTRGQCPEGEWAVMVAECQVECRPQPCLVGELEYQGRCVNLSDSTVCDEGQILYLDLQGSTFCACELDSFYYPWSGQCYARREQGPCDFGFFLDINESGDVDCMPNECKVDDFEKDPDSGKCYRKVFDGYCPVNSLIFYNNNQTVDCFILDIRTLFDRAITRSCSSGSGLDHRDNCRPEVVVPSITSLPRSLTRGCRSGAINVGSGPCRRVNTYL